MVGHITPGRGRSWWRTACIVALIAVASWGATLALTALAKPDTAPAGANLLRFHVLGNSDTAHDQAVKLAVRDKVLEATDSLFARAKTASEARSLATAHATEIESVANAALAAAGAAYRARVVVGDFEFPVKRYGDLVLPAGQYAAVRVLLGKAQGHNWWCVLFPPLCLRDFDSGFAISTSGAVSAKGQLASYAKGQAKAKRRPTVRFALRSLERQTGRAGTHLAMSARHAARAPKRQGTNAR
jgi:stage II sporulation protein R